MFKTFNLEDISQILIGAFVFGVTISFSEEAWTIGNELPLVNLGLVIVVTLSFLSVFTYYSVFQANIQHRKREFILRVVCSYAISVAVMAILLLTLDKLPLLESPDIALKRLIVMAMPASMGAVIVDSFDKE